MIDVRYYPCQFEDRHIEFKTHNVTPISILLSLAQKHPEIRENDSGLSIRVNGRLLAPHEWRKPLNPGDRIWFIQGVGYGILESIIAFIGLEVVTIGTTTFTVGELLMAAYVVASLAYTIYTAATAPDTPTTGKGLNNGATYGWDGIKMQARTGVPVAIAYGEHLIGGHLCHTILASYQRI